MSFSISNATEDTIFGMFVLPARKGKGTGRTLVNANEAWLWSDGMDKVWLVVGIETEGD